MNWQPIESAPKDGSDMWLWREDSGAFLGRWIAPVDFLTDSEIDTWLAGDPEIAEECDWFFADYVQGGRVTDGPPTHWQPLPPPPGSDDEFVRIPRLKDDGSET